MSLMMISGEDDSIIGSNVLLQASDFPQGYINQCHTTDYIQRFDPLTNLILHYNKLLLKISRNNYIPINFICDTVAPEFFYICDRAMTFLVDKILIDKISSYKYFLIDGKKLPINDTPQNHTNINIIGLRVLLLFGLHI